MNDRPIRRIVPSKRYAASFRKLDPPIQYRLIEREQLFVQNAHHPGLRTHKLEGHLGERGYWAYWIDERHRVMFKFLDLHSVLYIDVGDHRIY